MGPFVRRASDSIADGPPQRLAEELNPSRMSACLATTGCVQHMLCGRSGTSVRIIAAASRFGARACVWVRGKFSCVTVVVLTGATRGIGRAAAIELARRGAEVALVGRDPERVKSVAEEAAAAGGGGRVHGHVVDLALMSNVRMLADEIRGRYEHVDVLANNAGALFASRKETPEGFEQTFALNHLAPFLLTNLLRDRLAGGRVVTTASNAHKSARL